MSYIRQEIGAEAQQDIETDLRTKIFNDPIHGLMEIHSPCIEIIDTLQFQRLRSIKQISGGYYVYSGFSHNRFEHSIGVCHLAGRLTTVIRKRQPELEIDDKDIRCLEIAGLCHALGLGPFSDLFEEKFIPELIGENETWTHEDATIKMFDYILAKNRKVAQAFEAKGLSDVDKTFIKELIGQKGQTGRPAHKRFLYDIVSNKSSGIDVNKWDYFARDCHLLGIKSSFDHKRLMSSARVIKTHEGEPQICYREKDAMDVYDMFHTRHTLYVRAYLHKTSRSIEEMIKDALVLANEFLLFEGDQGRMLKMSEAIYDMTAYMKMTDDYIFNLILYGAHNHPNAVNARDLLLNVCQRNIYKLVGQTQLKAAQIAKDTRRKSRESKEKILKILRNMAIPDQPKEEDVFVDVVNLNYGKENENPIDSVYFYTKADPKTPFKTRKDQVSQMLPENFEEQYIRLYSKNCTAEQKDHLEEAFHKWCKDNVYPVPKGM